MRRTSIRGTRRIRSRLIIIAVLLGAIAPATHAAGPRDRGHGDRAHGHSAGILQIGKHRYEIDARGSLRHALVRTFHKAGYQSRLYRGAARVYLGYHAPAVHWYDGSHGLRIEKHGRFLMIYPYEIKSKHHGKGHGSDHRYRAGAHHKDHGRHARSIDKYRRPPHDRSRPHAARTHTAISIRIGGRRGDGFHVRSNGSVRSYGRRGSFRHGSRYPYCP